MLSSIYKRFLFIGTVAVIWAGSALVFCRHHSDSGIAITSIVQTSTFWSAVDPDKYKYDNIDDAIMRAFENYNCFWQEPKYRNM